MIDLSQKGDRWCYFRNSLGGNFYSPHSMQLPIGQSPFLTSLREELRVYPASGQKPIFLEARRIAPRF